MIQELEINIYTIDGITAALNKYNDSKFQDEKPASRPTTKLKRILSDMGNKHTGTGLSQVHTIADVYNFYSKYFDDIDSCPIIEPRIAKALVDKAINDGILTEEGEQKEQ